MIDATPLIDDGVVRRTLDAAGLEEGPIEIVPLGAGHSNLTFLVTRGESKYVIRRPPRPPIPPSAHDVVREARILRALAGTCARVPAVLAVVPEDPVTGAPFFVMEYVPGFVPTDRLPSDIDDPVDRRAIGNALVESLGELHSVPPPASFGHPEGFLERQVRRFTELWTYSKTREIPLVDEVAQRLARTIPKSGPPTIVHGDFRLGNIILAETRPVEIKAILDWEMATVGDPLTDLGYLTATWVSSDYVPGPLALSPITAAPGFPTRDDLVELYAALTGREPRMLGWYRALALWKGAIFLEGNHRRWLKGASTDAYYGEIGDQIPTVVELAMEELLAPH